MSSPASISASISEASARYADQRAIDPVVSSYPDPSNAIATIVSSYPDLSIAIVPIVSSSHDCTDALPASVYASASVHLSPMHRYAAHPVPDQCLPVHEQLEATNCIQEFQCNERSSSFANASERTSLATHRCNSLCAALNLALVQVLIASAMLMLAKIWRTPMRLCLATYRLALIALLVISALAITATEARADTQELQSECGRGDGFACWVLGYRYNTGRGGVREDVFRARELYTKACDLGNSMGCSSLGSMHMLGEGVRQDTLKAIVFFTKACDSANTEYTNVPGIAAGCFNLGIAYERGDGVRQSSSRAKQLYGKACDLRNEDGCKAYSRLNRR